MSSLILGLPSYLHFNRKSPKKCLVLVSQSVVTFLYWWWTGKNTVVEWSRVEGQIQHASQLQIDTIENDESIDLRNKINLKTLEHIFHMEYIGSKFNHLEVILIFWVYSKNNPMAVKLEMSIVGQQFFKIANSIGLNFTIVLLLSKNACKIHRAMSANKIEIQIVQLIYMKQILS